MEDRKKKEKKRRAKKIRLWSYMLTLGQIGFWVVRYLFVRKYKKRIRALEKREKKELTRLVRGRESVWDFFRHSGGHLKNFFIPHEGNNHRPVSLHARNLALYLIIVVAIKVLATSFLFFVYPTPAHMARIVASRMYELTNEARADAGVLPLSVNEVLVYSALSKGEHMIANNYFSHDAPDGTKPWYWINKEYYDYVYAGENLAMDFTSAELVQKAFMKSASHKKNILNEKYRDMGIAVITGELMGAETDLLVEFFGTKRSDYLAMASAAEKPAEPSGSAVAAPEPAPQPASAPAPPPSPIPTSPAPTTDEAVQEPAANTQAGASDEDSKATAGTSGDIEPGEAAGASLGNDGIPDMSRQVIVFGGEATWQDALADKIITWTQVAYMAFILFVVFSLFLSIFINFHIQHHSVIIQSLVVLALMSAILISKIHFAEKIIGSVIIA